MKKLLLADDDMDYLQFLVSVLSKDFQPVTAIGVVDALNVFRTSQVDAICSNLYMRDGTGLELLEMVRKQNIRIPFMLMSGDDDIWIDNQARSYGAIALVYLWFVNNTGNNTAASVLWCIVNIIWLIAEIICTKKSEYPIYKNWRVWICSLFLLLALFTLAVYLFTASMP